MGFNLAFKGLLLVQDFCFRRACQRVTVLLLSVFFLILFPAIYITALNENTQRYYEVHFIFLSLCVIARTAAVIFKYGGKVLRQVS